MATYQEYDQELTGYLLVAIEEEYALSKKTSPRTEDITTLLGDLIDAIPYYEDPEWLNIHRNTLINLFNINLPNEEVEPPEDVYDAYTIIWDYTGPYSGYQDAFFDQKNLTPAGSQVASEVIAVDAQMNPTWWGSFSLAILCDAIPQEVSVSISRSRVEEDLNSYHNRFLTGLTPSYLGVFTEGYGPTSQAYKALTGAGLTAEAGQLLDAALTNNYFTANINTIIGLGGDGMQAGMWFLYNLWDCLKVLGNTYQVIDENIVRYMDNGLIVPPEVGANSWWTGGYHRWFIQLSGEDITSHTETMIQAKMPAQEVNIPYSPPGTPPRPPVTIQHQLENGYCFSLCEYGKLNKYYTS